MTRKPILLLLAASALPLGGCAAAIAANAVGMVASGARGSGTANAHLAPVAAKACSERAAAHGAVHIIDVEQRSADRIIVWGTVEQSGHRRSFECAFGTSITSFKLREIRVRR